MKLLILAFAVLAAGCESLMAPTGPTHTQMTLTISQSSLPVGGTAIVTATLTGDDGGPVSFTSSMGAFAPAQAYARGGVATSTFTATRAGIGEIGALAGSVAERLQVRIGDFPTLPPIDNTPPAPTVFVSCANGGVAGLPTICSVSGSGLQQLVINWGDGSSDQSISPSAVSVAHVFGNVGQFTVSVRGSDALGRVASASTTAGISAPPAPPPAPEPVTPQPVTTSVFVSQEANIVNGCAVFNASATAATGTTVRVFWLEHHNGTQTNLNAPRDRVALCGLQVGNVVTAKAGDMNGGSASYPLIVK